MFVQLEFFLSQNRHWLLRPLIKPDHCSTIDYPRELKMNKNKYVSTNLALVLNYWPTGDKVKVIWRLFLSWLLNIYSIFSLVSGIFRSLTTYRMSLSTSSQSSGLKILDTPPEFRILLISSRKDSCKIWLSLNKNMVYWFLQPVSLTTFFRSSFHDWSLYALWI